MIELSGDFSTWTSIKSKKQVELYKDFKTKKDFKEAKDRIKFFKSMGWGLFIIQEHEVEDMQTNPFLAQDFKERFLKFHEKEN